MSWVHQYRPEIEKRIRKHLKETNDSWRVDERWVYLYRAVDSNSDTVDIMLSVKRDAKAAYHKAIKELNNNVDLNML